MGAQSYGIYLRVSDIKYEHEKINSISLSMYYSVYYINTTIIHSQTCSGEASFIDHEYDKR